MSGAADIIPAGRSGRFAPFQGLAALICAGIFLGVLAALANVAVGRGAAPSGLRDVFIASHLALLMATLALTVAQLVMRKGTDLHKKLGYAWSATLLAGMAVSFGIHEINGGLSIPHYHAMASFVLAPLIAWLGMTGRRRWHKRLVLFYVFYFIIVAGVLTFLGDERVIAQMWRDLF